MAYSFSANQYEDAFIGKKLTNWTLPRKYKPRPGRYDGYTQFIANDRGHILDKVPRSKESPWGTFMGTWDMPRDIPPPRPCFTARSKHAAESLKDFKDSSPLNNAVNGFKPFRYDQQRRRTVCGKSMATPPPSRVEEAVSGRASKGNGSARKTPIRKSASPPVQQEVAFLPTPEGRPASNARTPVEGDGEGLRPLYRNPTPQAPASKANTPTRLINEGVSVPVSSPSPRSGAASRQERAATGLSKAEGGGIPALTCCKEDVFATS